MLKLCIFIGVFISLSLFYYYNQKARTRREQRRSDRKERHEQMMESILKAKNVDTDPANKDDL